MDRPNVDREIELSLESRADQREAGISVWQI
jgi:hypothetical protein